jgi:hypothetical protein
MTKGRKEVGKMEELDIVSLLKSGVSEKAKIIKIEAKDPKEVFKDRAKSTRPVLEISTENNARDIFTLPEGLNYKDGKFVVTNKIRVVQSLQNRNSKLGNFVRKYGKLPEIGMEVETTVNEKTGFTQIVV